MKLHELVLTTNEVCILRDAVGDATVAQREHVGQQKDPSEGAKKRLVALEALLANLKQLALR